MNCLNNDILAYTSNIEEKLLKICYVVVDLSKLLHLNKQ